MLERLLAPPTFRHQQKPAGPVDWQRDMYAAQRQLGSELQMRLLTRYAPEEALASVEHQLVKDFVGAAGRVFVAQHDAGIIVHEDEIEQEGVHLDVYTCLANNAQEVVRKAARALSHVAYA